MEEFRTANCLEDLDIEFELNSFDSVGHAVGRGSFHGVEDKYHDVDFYIIMMDDSEEDEIKKTLKTCGWKAWLEYDEEDECRMVRVG